MAMRLAQRLSAIIVTAAMLAATANAEADLSGAELFQEHCAVCHGTDASGKGPMAQALKTLPADLTAIAKRAGGTFPAAHIVEVITYGGNIAAHGSETMPVWGKVFSDKGGRGKVGAGYSRRAVIELKRYLETIQKN
jgi:mono/diheme cytochrome c family protein